MYSLEDFWTITKNGLLLMKNILKTLANSVLIPLWLTALASTIDVAIRKKIFRSGMTILTISNEEMVDIMKITISLEGSILFIDKKC